MIKQNSPDVSFPALDGEDIVVGVHCSGILLEEGLNTSLSRNYCANCKRKIHCYVKVDRKTNEAIVHNTCKDNNCECKCKTHFACKQCGYLHAYATKCNRVDSEPIPNPESEKIFQEIMEGWREFQEK